MPKDNHLRSVSSHTAFAQGKLRTLRDKVLPAAERRGTSWLFLATLPNSGSTAFAKLMSTSPRVVLVHREGEGHWMVPGFADAGRLWDPDFPFDQAAVRRIWLGVVRQQGIRPCVVMEKGPANMVRMRQLLALFSDMQTTVLRLTRDPYAICASWRKRYGIKHLRERWQAEQYGPIETEEDRLRTFGAICGARYEILRGLEDLSSLTFSYERLTAHPEEVAREIQAAVPGIGSIDLAAKLPVKDYAPQSLSNMNAGQIDSLSARDIDLITEGLAPHEETLRAFGYALRR
ncbi:MAG: hypothetical protein AAFN17_01650 [Pseudomonadota bacterium]